MAPVLGLLALCGGFFFVLVLPVMTAVFALQVRAGRRSRTGLVVAAVMLVAFFVSAAGIWGLVSTQWTLSLPATFEASVNSAKFGHPVEHRAEVILVWLLLGSSAIAFLAGAIAAKTMSHRGSPR